jgi:FkbM family methyltransferase
VGFHLPQAHYQLTRLAITLGPDNPFVRFLLRRACAQRGVGVEFSSDALDLVKADCVIRISPKNWIYAPSIASSFDAYFGQVEATPNGAALVVDYSGPRLQKYRSSGLEFEINSFPEEDSAIEDYFRWYRPKEGDVVFDLGAYCGVSTYVFSKAVGESGRVYSFEPDAGSYALLLRNVNRHQLRNVIPLQFAVAATSGQAEFHQEGTLGSVLSRHSPRATTGIVSTVPTIDLSAACERFGLPSFVKVDIEGSEVEVLEGSRDFLRRNSINFALDTHHWVNGTRTTQQVERIFGECGYETDSSDASGFWTTWARKVARQDVGAE